MMHRWIALVLMAGFAGCGPAPSTGTPGTGTAETRYDVLIRNGLVYDGSGAAPQEMDVALDGDRVVALLPRPSGADAVYVIDAAGRAVAPGFINVLSWATESLIEDGRGMSDTLQGVTLEIFGEGWSMGPLNPDMKAEAERRQGDIKYAIDWASLGEYLEYLERRGITPNVASFVGATTVRMHELGEADVQPDEEQLRRMQDLVREAMREGALGVGSSLIYPPAFFAKTDELIALSQAAAEFGGGYISHMRSEANQLLRAVDEIVSIGRATGERVEIYHLKAAGEKNWPVMADAVAKVEAARDEGVLIGANMYAYTAGATGLTAGLPPWVQDGGHAAMVERLRDPSIRARVIAEMKEPSDAWENLRLLAGSADRVLLIGFRNEELKPLTGQSLAQVSEARATPVEDTIIDLILEDDSRVDAAYFLMSEDNVELGLRQPWVSLGSDAESSAPEGVFLESSTHPRAYGNFARFLGHYTRDRQLMPLAEAIHRLTGLPARNWKLKDRGCLRKGCFADLVVFDPAAVRDHATFDDPQQYADGVSDVFVNGVPVLREGKHTGATPGRVVRGPGWTGGPVP